MRRGWAQEHSSPGWWRKPSAPPDATGTPAYVNRRIAAGAHAADPVDHRESRRRQAVPQNDTPASDDAVGVAVVNYKMPRLRTRAEVPANANKIRQMIEGLKLGLPGLDLVIFPAYSTHGLLQGDGHDDDAMLNTVGSIPGDETAVLARACRNAQVWGVFSLGCPAEHTLVLMDDQGDIVQAHRGTDCDMPSVCAGPKGMTVSLSDGHSASAAELIVGCPVESTALPAPQALALAHHSYVAVANAAGFDGVRCHFGRSAVIASSSCNSANG
jgi:amidase